CYFEKICSHFIYKYRKIVYRKRKEMTIIIKLNEEKSLLINLKRYKKENKIKIDSFSYISTNYSLFKYLIDLFKINSISTNENGYVVLRRKDRTITSLQRI